MNETSNVLETRQKYRSWMNRAMGTSIFGGAALLTAAALLERDLLVFLGVAVYWAGMLGYLAIKRRSPVRTRDEREARISQEASELTLNVLAAVLIFGAPAITVLETTGAYEVSRFVWGMVTMLVVVAMVVAAANWYVERRRS